MVNKIRIILPNNSSGLNQDALIYKNILPNSFIVNGYDIENQKKELYKKKEYINLYIERPPGKYIISNKYFPSEKNWIMINQELIKTYNKKLNTIYNIFELILCKTKYAYELFNNYKKNNVNINYKPIYTGFTSLCKNVSNIQKDYNLIVHFAGKSPYKNTKLIIDSWLNNNGFIEYNKNIKLIITCFEDKDWNESCIFTQLNKWNNLNNKKKTMNNKCEYISPIPNLIICNKKIDNIEYLQQKAGCSLCPSSQEGFGHYINESKCNKSIIISTDGKPMNELVKKEYGILIKPIKTKQIKTSIEGSYLYELSEEDITKSIIKYIKIPLLKKKQMSKKSFESFISNTEFFNNSMNKLF